MTEKCKVCKYFRPTDKYCYYFGYDIQYSDDCKEHLTINEVLCVLNDLHKDNLELKNTMKRMAIEMMGG